MDNITHGLIGVAVANAGLKQKWGRGTLFTLFLASNLPDVDAIAMLGNPFGFLNRRMLTHSLFGLPALVVLAALILRKFYPNLTFKKILGLCFLGAGLHVFFDLLNSYGVVLFYPASRARFEFACVFIVDLVLLAILIFPLLFSWIKSRWTRLEILSRVALGSLTGYLFFCFWARWSTIEDMRTIANNEHLRPTITYAFPEALGPHRFRGVIKVDDEYRLYLVDVLKPSTDERRIAAAAYFKTEENEPAVLAIRRRPEVQRLEWFAKAPVWQEVRPAADGRPAVYEVFDLRFISFVLQARRPFTFEFEADPT